MDIQNLVPVDYSNQRVLTTAQVADVFHCKTTRIRDNFRHNRKHYVEGVHYFKVEGEALRALKEVDAENFRSQATQSSPIANATRALLLWTKQGVARICQSFKTQEAWNIFDELERHYFQVAETPAVTPSNEPQLFTHPHFGNLRVVIINGEVWFVGIDVARALGYKDTDQAIRYHVDERDKLPRKIYGVNYPVILINKSGLNSLILDSNLPKAKEYRHWVTSEVLVQVDEKGYYCPQGSLFPDEPTAQKKVRRPAPECALVYAVLLSNLLVKIGLSSDFNRRLKELRKETHCDILEWATTTMLPFLDAVKFEKNCKDKFFDYVVDGEFFNAPFAQVKAALQASPVDKLLAIADRMEPSPEKNIILNQAAAIILSKKNKYMEHQPVRL